MSTIKLYSVFDSKVSAFMKPIFFQTHGEALRAFSELCNDPQSQVCKYAEDFAMFYHGTFDPSSGELWCEAAPQHLAHAVEYKRAPTGGLPLLDRADNLIKQAANGVDPSIDGSSHVG